MDGHDPKVYQLESHLRFSKAFIPIIMILIGMPFALQRGRQASFALGVVISLSIFIAYFILYAVFAALGSSAILPPLIAAWSSEHPHGSRWHVDVSQGSRLIMAP